MTDPHDTRRARRIRTETQQAVHVPVRLLALLLAVAPYPVRATADRTLGRRTVGAVLEAAR